MSTTLLSIPWTRDNALEYRSARVIKPFILIASPLTFDLPKRCTDFPLQVKISPPSLLVHPIRDRWYQRSLTLDDKVDQVLDGADLEPPPARKLQAPVPPEHARPGHLGAPRTSLDAVVDELANDTDLALPRQPTQLDRRLGVTGALPDAAVARPQREDVARPPEVRRLHVLGRERAARQGAVVRRDACRDTSRSVVGVDRDGVGGPVRVGVVVDHLR